jgi:hypothetical protein
MISEGIRKTGSSLESKHEVLPELRIARQTADSWLKEARPESAQKDQLVAVERELAWSYVVSKEEVCRLVSSSRSSV